MQNPRNTTIILLLALWCSLGFLVLACNAPASVKPLPVEPIVHKDTKCPYFDFVWGCSLTIPPATAIIYIEPGAPYWTLYHEYGHVFDAFSMDDSERSFFRRSVFPRRTKWIGYVEEQFSHYYARCALNNRKAVWKVRWSEYHLACNLINYF